VRRPGLVAFAVVAATVSLGGAFLLPRALEPGSSEANGITLNLLIGSGNLREANDWYPGQSSVTARTDGTAIVVESGRSHGLQLISRPLPVFPGTAYQFDVDVRVSGAPAVLAIGDTDLRWYLAAHPMPPGTDQRVHFVFSSRSERRITVAFLAKPGAAIRIANPRLARR